MRNRGVLTGLLVLLSIGWSYAQKNGFQFKRDIEKVTSAGWYQIKLPADVAGRTQTYFQDIRIYDIENSDTTEVPYLLKILENKTSEKAATVPVINKSFKDGELYVTLEIPKERANSLHLNFSENNFEGFVTIEGSNDQKEWFSLIEKSRILAINDKDVNFNFTTINFPLSNYSFLRVHIKSTNPLDLLSATLTRRETLQGRISDHQLSWNSKVDKDAKQTTAEIILKNIALINQINVDVSNEGDYYRPFTLEILRDSSKTEKEWIYYYDELTSGYLTSADTSTITFQNVKARKLRLTIRNFDNPPLTIRNIRIGGPDVVLLAKLSPGQFFLAYDNPRSTAPSYDLKHFEQNIPENIPDAILKGEEWIGQETPATNPLFEQKIWLWSVMGIIIALLGFFTMRMMKKA